MDQMNNVPTNRKEEIQKYKRKIQNLKKVIREYVHENASLCDEINEIQDKTIIYYEQRKYLLKKLCQHDPNMEAEIEDIYQQLNATQHPERPKIKKPRQTPEPGTIHIDVSKKPSTGKPRKSTSKPKKKFAQPIPLDPIGRPIFPIELGSVTIHSLGEVVCDRREFHTDEVIFPVGYVSTKIYGSIHEPTVKCVYTCKISDVNGLPRFEIGSDDNASPIVGGNPDICHSILLQKLNHTLSRNVIPTRPRGNDFFGLSHPVVANLLQSSPGARRCVHYKWNKIEISKNAECLMEDTDSTLNFDSLIKSIELFKYNMEELSNANKSGTLNSAH